MTREEAKEILTHNWTRVDNPNYSESELDEAFFMAIEALSANDGLRCALTGGRKCFAQGYDFTWCITCPHISEEDRQLVNHAVLALPSADAVEVVRCKDCKNRARYAVCDYLGEDGYCSLGKSREDGE